MCWGTGGSNHFSDSKLDPWCPQIQNVYSSIFSQLFFRDGFTKLAGNFSNCLRKFAILCNEFTKIVINFWNWLTAFIVFFFVTDIGNLRFFHDRLMQFATFFNNHLTKFEVVFSRPKTKFTIFFTIDWQKSSIFRWNSWFDSAIIRENSGLIFGIDWQNSLGFFRDQYVKFRIFPRSIDTVRNFFSAIVWRNMRLHFDCLAEFRNNF